MISEDTIELNDGSVIEIEDHWELDFGKDRPMDRFFRLQRIDGALCDHANVVKTKCGRFFLLWYERHPELGRFNEYFGDTFEARENPDNQKEWGELVKRMPCEHFVEEIPRKEAYELVLYFWLPAEFHSDAGIF